MYRLSAMYIHVHTCLLRYQCNRSSGLDAISISDQVGNIVLQVCDVELPLDTEHLIQILYNHVLEELGLIN